MSIYVLLEYIELCKTIEVEPSWNGLKNYKTKYWRD